MFGQNNSRKDENFNIFVVSSIDDTVKETYKTGIRDCVPFSLNEARMALNRLGNGYYITTDNPEIAKEYGIKLKENNTY